MGEGMIVRRGGSGGARLRVLAAADAALLPENAKDGCIGIVTDVAVGDVYAQQDEPAGAFVVGDVWLRTGLSSTIAVNIAKKGTLMVYVWVCYQWDGEAFVRRDTYIRAGGAWVEMGLALYEDGDQKKAITGGWIHMASGTLTVYDDSIYLAAPDGLHSSMVTQGLVDVTNYSKLEVMGADMPDVTGAVAINSAGAMKLAVRTRTGGGDVMSQTFEGTFAQGNVFTADISSITGRYYVAAMAYNGRKCYVRGVRLVP